MKKKNGTIYRQWLILKMFPSRGKISTTTLRDRIASEYSIDVTLRTIQRDLVSLEECRFPLECDGNNPAGWSWRKDAPVFGINNMDPVTALTFNLARKHLEHMFPRGAMSVLEPYFKAANERMKLTQESSLSHWPDKVRVVSRNLPMKYPHVGEEIMDKVYTSVLEERRFNATYRTLAGEIKEYDVNPLGMAFVEGQTYLIATLFNYDDPVSLVLHRMLEVKVSDVPVRIPDGFELDEFINKELKFPVGDDIRLKVRFFGGLDVTRIRETPISEDQKITEQNGSWILQASVSNSFQLRWWLRGYGERVEVIAPKALRNEFEQMACEMVKRYNPSAQ